MGILFCGQNVGNWVGWDLYDAWFENLIQHISRKKNETTKTSDTSKYKCAGKKKTMDMDALIVTIALTTWPPASNCNGPLD